MTWIDWIGQNWSALFQTGAVTAALLFAGFALLFDARSRRADNLIRLTDRHRDLWERMYTQQRLARVLDPTANLARMPVTTEEEQFVIFVILHLSDSFYLMNAGFFEKPRGLREDVRQFFSLPIPKAVWSRARDLQDAPFVRFVESCCSEAELSNRKKAA